MLQDVLYLNQLGENDESVRTFIRFIFPDEPTGSAASLIKARAVRCSDTPVAFASEGVLTTIILRQWKTSNGEREGIFEVGAMIWKTDNSLPAAKSVEDIFIRDCLLIAFQELDKGYANWLKHPPELAADLMRAFLKHGTIHEPDGPRKERVWTALHWPVWEYHRTPYKERAVELETSNVQLSGDQLRLLAKDMKLPRVKWIKRGKSP